MHSLMTDREERAGGRGRAGFMKDARDRWLDRNQRAGERFTKSLCSPNSSEREEGRVWLKLRDANGLGTFMTYYECPVCGGGYVFDPAPAHPKCDRDGAALKRASEASYVLNAREDIYGPQSVKRKSYSKTKGR